MAKVFNGSVHIDVPADLTESPPVHNGFHPPGFDPSTCEACKMSNDPTESVRRSMINSGQPHRDLAEAKEQWTTEELGREFEVVGFLAPFVVVKRRSDGVKGSLEFTHSPRVYFNWTPDKRS